MSTQTITCAEEFFDALETSFEKKNNKVGLEVLVSIRNSWSRYNNLSERQIQWVKNNSHIHKLSLSDDLKEFIADNQTLTIVERPVLKLPKPVQEPSQVAKLQKNTSNLTDMEKELIRCLVQTTQSLENTVCQLIDFTRMLVERENPNTPSGDGK